MNQRDIRKSKWFEEVAEYFHLPQQLLLDAVPNGSSSSQAKRQKAALAQGKLKEMFMSGESIDLLEKIEKGDPKTITDQERSNAWREYIFLCINAEKRAHDRMYFLDSIIQCVVDPACQLKESPFIVDYGCGSSLFTRLIAQDFGSKVKTLSVDVCKYTIEFSVARNSLYNQNASGRVVQDVMDVLDVQNADVIFAHNVFEHLPNASNQIAGLVNSLGPDGVLVETYPGHSNEQPHKSDTFSSYTQRDQNLDFLANQLRLVYGPMPSKTNGVYKANKGFRCWIAKKGSEDLAQEIRRRFYSPEVLLKTMFGKLFFKLSRILHFSI